MKKSLILLGILSLVVITSLCIQKQSDPSPQVNETDAVEVLITDLDMPWAIAFLPDDTLVFTERRGNVSIYRDGQVALVGTLPVHHTHESGLHGIAVDPNFDKNQYLYIYYTRQDGNRISRFTLTEDWKLTDEFVLIDKIPQATIHDGGRLRIGPDGKLYISTGDAGDADLAQDPQSLAGKILRINLDGTIPEDNPFGNAVWSYGHRNPQGLDFNLRGELYATEHGLYRHDEVNKIVRGGNYGWPTNCEEQTDETVRPVLCYLNFTLAPSGIDFNNNVLYIAGLRGTQVRKITFDHDWNVTAEEEFFVDVGRVREAVVHKGYLYITTHNRDGKYPAAEDDDKIIRIDLARYNGTGQYNHHLTD